MGTFESIGHCANACRQKDHCKFFVYGYGPKEGACWWEHTKTADCSEGWIYNEHDFYEITGNICITKPVKLNFCLT